MNVSEWILIRHGESEDNAGKIRDPNSTLSRKGREQCAQAAEHLSSLDVSQYRIVCSPLERAKETASILCYSLGWPIPEIDASLYEFGEEVTFGGRHYPRESLQQFHDRMLGFIERRKLENLIAVAHGHVINALMQFLNKRMFDPSKFIGIENCAVNTLTVPSEAIAHNIW